MRCASSRSDSTAHSVPSAPPATPCPNATRSSADGTTLEGRSAAVRAAQAVIRLRSMPNSAGLWPARRTANLGLKRHRCGCYGVRAFRVRVDELSDIKLRVLQA